MTKRRKFKIVSRQVALRRGLLRYFTGEPCKHGHHAERWTGNRICVECMRITTSRWQKSDEGHAAQRRYNRSPNSRAAQRRYWRSPKGRDNQWRVHQSPKGRERQRQYNQSPKRREQDRERRRTEDRRTSDREYHRKAKYRTKANARRRELRLERIEAAYNISPTDANWNRLQRVIARRRRDGR
jgi:hypothetical protein